MGKYGQALTTLGVTGTIGSGKSMVGKLLRELNIPVIDTDEIVHGLLASDKETQELVIERFGKEVIANSLSSDQSIDRKALGRIVFKDTAARTDLEKILHPRVRRVCRAQVASYAQEASHPVIAFLVPLLFEAGLDDEYDQNWTIVTRQPVLEDRLLKRDGFSPSELKERLATQWPQEKKAALADKVIDNSGTIDETRTQVSHLLNGLMNTGNETSPMR